MSIREFAKELENRMVEFSVRVMKLMDELPRSRRVDRLSDQIERSASSAGANYHEANFAVSKADFNNKLGIVIKEINETKFWLKVITKLNLHSRNRIRSEYDECEELLSLFITIRRRSSTNN